MIARLLLVLLVSALGLQTAGCVYSHAGPGLLYMNVKGPLGPAEGSPGGSTGSACAVNVFGLVAAGDATIDTAKRNGGVSSAETVEYHSTNILGYGTFCTVVDD